MGPRFTELFGWKPGEILGKYALELVHPDDRDAVEAIRVQAMTEERPAQLVFRLARREGGWRWVELAGRPYRTFSGEQRAVLVLRDATEKMATAHALREQLHAEQRIAELSRRFLGLGADGFEAGIREGLQAAAEMVGADRAQLFAYPPGRSRFGGIFEWRAEGIPGREGLGGVEEAVHDFAWSRDALERGEPIRVSRVPELPPAAEPERRSFERAGVKSYLAIPVRRDERIVGFLDVFCHRAEKSWTDQDVSRLELFAEVFSTALRRLRAEEARAVTDERFRRLTERARDAICELTAEGRLLYASPSFVNLFGFEPERARRRRLADVRASGGSDGGGAARLAAGARRAAPGRDVPGAPPRRPLALGRGLGLGLRPARRREPDRARDPRRGGARGAPAGARPAAGSRRRASPRSRASCSAPRAPRSTRRSSARSAWRRRSPARTAATW